MPFSDSHYLFCVILGSIISSCLKLQLLCFSFLDYIHCLQYLVNLLFLNKTTEHQNFMQEDFLVVSEHTNPFTHISKVRKAFLAVFHLLFLITSLHCPSNSEVGAAVHYVIYLVLL